ncbi:MAG: hypothetical protein E6J43_13090 [Chloroflexi bacterium]|nr:MAG: hypothetical protein E6J43_13090 [Chloroflexota bacterium]
MIQDRNAARHFLMRLGLCSVMYWFAIQELRMPSDWAVFVPSFVMDFSPVAVDQLILLHGFLLLLGASSIVLGLFYLPGCLLASGLILEILLGLWWDDGINDVVVRDVGLLALAVALTIDPARSWHLDNLLPAFFATAPPGPARGHVAAARRRGWPLKAGAGVGLLTAVLATGLALYATGSGGESLPGGSVAALTNAGTPVPQTSPRASSGPLATPTQSPSVRFDDWRYKQYAFQIYPGELGTEAKKALAGFQLNLQDEGDSVLVLLKATSARYKDAQYTVDKRDTAYFIETTMRDDPNDQENNLRDDGVIEVDAQGYIVNS